MKTNQLGRSNIRVSAICLGTMTWGSQNSQSEADEQLDFAVGEGINFFDTAEMYPTTPRKKGTTGLTEEILGNWISGRADRDELVVATKVTGEGNKDIRDGARVTGKILRAALEESLARLKTDRVDLYQLHWPNRGSYHFRRYWAYDPRNTRPGDMEGEIADLLGEVARLREEGKLREFGLSNETAWGVMKFLGVAEKHGLPRPVSIQNEYSLICRIFDTDLAEIAVNEDIGLLAYSPLSAGLLSGKYLDGALPQGSRMSMQSGLNGRRTGKSEEAVAAYCAIAHGHGMQPAQLAIAFCMSRPFMTAPIIGATSMEQLGSNVAAKSMELDDEVLAEIDAVHRQFGMPM